jgi:hypothetical protein
MSDNKVKIFRFDIENLSNGNGSKEQRMIKYEIILDDGTILSDKFIVPMT